MPIRGFAGARATGRMAQRLLLKRSIMAKTKKQQQAQEQKLFDAVNYAASCLKEAGEPLYNLGPSAQYAAVFDRYAQALKALVVFECPLHVADWSWNGYDGRFDFRWEFGAQLSQPGVPYEHNTRFLEMSCRAQLDLDKPLSEELARLRAEAEHYNELLLATMRWAAEVRKKSLAATSGAEQAS